MYSTPCFVAANDVSVVAALCVDRVVVAVHVVVDTTLLSLQGPVRRTRE